MSKIIKMTPELLNEVCTEFEENMKTSKIADGKISFSKVLAAVSRKATLCFTETAWMKMKLLVGEFSDEVAWHGVAKRSEDPDKDEYIVSDIMVYPQQVTGSTVNTDQTEYQNWLYAQEDEVFNNLRFQGHSHVNMGVTPSGVDLNHQSEILQMLDDDMFFIFLIMNKKGDRTIKIYDLAKNILFETTDITVKIIDDGSGFKKFVETSKEMVVKKVYSATNKKDETPSYLKDHTSQANNQKKDDENSVSLLKNDKKNKKKGRRKIHRLLDGSYYSNGYGGYDDYYDDGYDNEVYAR